ncbi:transposable element Tcb2 transposase [Trichonephila clavipes]|nr:transposable element Tcb2 transposase [Trichonephila clavipes]
MNIFGSDGRRTVWRKPNTALDPKNLRSTDKHGGGSVMVMDCMASYGVENLVFLDSIMDHKLYIDILNNNLKESAKKLGLDGSFIFQQDNDPKYTARNVKMGLRALQAEAASRSCDRDDEQKLSGREMVKKRGQQAEGAKGPSSLFLLSDDNLIRRYTKFIIEWPYPFLFLSW